MNPNARPFQPWPGLEPYASKVHLPKSNFDLFCYLAGDRNAPPLLLIHGLGDEADTWRHLIPSLASRWRVVAPDLPGFGRSSQPERAYTLEFFQAALLELLDALHIEKATLVGHSLGAAIAHALALEHPGRVERLVLISGSLVAKVQKVDLATMLFIVPGLGEWMYNRLRKNPQEAYRSLDIYYADLPGLPAADREFLFQRVNQRVWSDGQRRAFLSTLRSLARTLPGLQRSLPERLSGSHTPLTCIWGAADRVSSVENGQALATLAPHTRLVIIPQAGHNLHQENPQAVLAEAGSPVIKGNGPKI
jgi:pimeloyl-ACP methyl ester carboxylesterase